MRSGKTPAQLLADHTRQAIEMCRRVTPDRVVAVWNDMYDPYHNAKPGRYYHVEKGFSGAWEAIDKDVLILNWNDKIESYKFFAERGNPQIFCGYYDNELGPDKEGRLVRQARQLPGVIGWMYTTWEANFGEMDNYLALSGYKPRTTTASEQLPALFLRQPKEEEVKEEDYYRLERSYGSFVRSVELPREVQTDKVKATFKNGVLEIRMPKSEEAKKKEIKVKVD